MKRESGHTLVELTIVTLLLGLIFTIIGQGSPSMNRNTLTMRARATTSSELRLAVEMLLADLGGAAQLIDDDGNLLIRREQEVATQLGAWTDGDDDGVTYWLDESGTLLRRDAELDTIVAVARAVTAFTIKQTIMTPGGTTPPGLGNPPGGPPGGGAPPPPSTGKGKGKGKGNGKDKGNGKSNSKSNGKSNGKGKDKGNGKDKGPPGGTLSGGGDPFDTSGGPEVEKTPLKVVTRIHLASGEGSAARSVDLLWSP